MDQAQIGEKIGWSRERVRDYIAILDKIGAQIINLAREHQTGRAPKIGAFATFDFTEGWFRNSGLYEPYSLAVTSNQDEDTYAPMDLFDWLDIIKKLREEGLTQAQIGDRIGWSREQVRNYIFVLDKVGTEVLDLARKHQNGRVPKNGTIVPFDFTEGWFRNSGLYDLCEKYQLALIEVY